MSWRNKAKNYARLEMQTLVQPRCTPSALPLPHPSASARPPARCARLFSANVHASARSLAPLTVLVALQVPGDDLLATQAARPRAAVDILYVLPELD